MDGDRLSRIERRLNILTWQVGGLAVMGIPSLWIAAAYRRESRRTRMSDNTDWTLIVLASQRDQIAAEAAMGSARLLESEAGGRLTTIEVRLGFIAFTHNGLPLVFRASSP
jgi:hypothetical protein